MKIQLKGTDAIQVRESGTCIAGYHIIDAAPKELKLKPHRDAVQFIPERKSGGVFNSQFAGAVIQHIEVRDNRIESDGALQCVFCSDGGIRGVIRDNVMQTAGEHYISVCILSGHIENNRDPEGNLVPVRLFPMRLGGNKDGAYNVYILTFKNPRYRYEPVESIVQDSTLEHVTDHRFGYQKRANSIYLYEFDLDAYITETEKRQLTASEMRALSVKFGKTEEPQKAKAKGIKMARGIRNCNPGNIEASPTNKWMGLACRSEMTEVQQQESRFCVFKDPVYGIRALTKLLQNYQSRHKLKSIKQLIARYAPRQDNNNTAAYVRVVSQAVGVSESQTVSMFDYTTAKAIVVAIIEHENGVQNPYTDDQLRQGLAMAGVSMPEELRDQRPLGRSREFTRGGAVIGGTTLVSGAEVAKRMTEQPVHQETTTVKAVTESGAVKTMEVIQPELVTVDKGLASMGMVDVLQLVLLLVIALAALDWMLDRKLTKELGLR